MARVWAPLLIALASLAVLLSASRNPNLLQDSDTRVLLATIREERNPWLWFHADWPLRNHFYRPISTLTFEADSALYGDQAKGYAWTNALLAALCTALLGWFVREWTAKPAYGAAAAGLFALWTLGRDGPLSLLGWLPFLFLGVGLASRPARWPGLILATLASWYWLDGLLGLQPLYGRMLGWIPGRTASSMAVFCLLAMAAYARWERLGNPPHPEPTPLTPPATRSSRQDAPRRAGPFWPVLALLSVALALGAYEQAVMLPACLLVVGFAFRLRGYAPRRGWLWMHGGAWALLIGYLVLRRVLLPVENSGYQEQQLRYGPGVWLALSSYVYPALGGWTSWVGMAELGPYLWLNSTPYVAIVEVAKPLAAAWIARQAWVLPLAAWSLSVLAFLPMAWLQHFEHYHYWPMALRAAFVVVLAPLVGRAWASAWSPPSRQAPPRLAPAPGSLPRL